MSGIPGVAEMLFYDRIDNIERWQRRLDVVNDGLVISGDLAMSRDRAIAQLGEWQAAGITHVLDCRAEWSDAELIDAHAPDLVHLNIGVHDDGNDPGDEFWNAGVAFAEEADRVGGRLLVHCHMGINRGPSMAYRILLEWGFGPLEGIEMIKAVRPMAQVRYGLEALDHFLGRWELPEEVLSEVLESVDALLGWGATRRDPGPERPTGEGSSR